MREPSAGVFELTQDGQGLSWRICPPQPGETYAAAGVRDEDLAELDGLDPPPRSQRDVQDRLRWGGSRALSVLQAWRDLRSGSAPEEQRAAQEMSAPRSAAPTVRSREHHTDHSAAVVALHLDDATTPP